MTAPATQQQPDAPRPAGLLARALFWAWIVAVLALYAYSFRDIIGLLYGALLG